MATPGRQRILGPPARRRTRLRRGTLPLGLVVFLVVWLHALALAQFAVAPASQALRRPLAQAFVTRTVYQEVVTPAPATTLVAPHAAPLKAVRSAQAGVAAQANAPSATVPAPRDTTPSDVLIASPPPASRELLAAAPAAAPLDPSSTTPSLPGASPGPLPITTATATVSAAATGASSMRVATPTPPALPVYTYKFPASSRLKYEVFGQVKGFGYKVDGELLWIQDGNTYEARLEVRHFLLGSRLQTSKGVLGAQGLEPLRFGDKVRSEVAAHFQRAKGLVSFSANTPDATLLPLAQDQISIFVQLAAMWGGDAARFVPGTQLAFQAVGPRSAESWVFVVGQTAQLAVGGRELAAVKLLRERSQDYDVRVELWLAPALDYLPARIRLTQSNGDEVDMQWRKTENL